MNSFRLNQKVRYVGNMQIVLSAGTIIEPETTGVVRSLKAGGHDLMVQFEGIPKLVLCGSFELISC